MHNAREGRWARQGYDDCIDLHAEVEHHSITGNWEVYMGRHLGIDCHRSQPPVKLWCCTSLHMHNAQEGGWARQGYDDCIDSHADVEHHSITGNWEVYMRRHLGIDFHRSQPPVKLWCSTSVHMHNAQEGGWARQGYDDCIDSHAEVEHHSITGNWKVYMGRLLGIDFHRSQPPVKLWCSTSPCGSV